jgi:hypothetical protein
MSGPQKSIFFLSLLYKFFGKMGIGLDIKLLTLFCNYYTINAKMIGTIWTLGWKIEKKLRICAGNTNPEFSGDSTDMAGKETQAAVKTKILIDHILSRVGVSVNGGFRTFLKTGATVLTEGRIDGGRMFAVWNRPLSAAGPENQTAAFAAVADEGAAVFIVHGIDLMVQACFVRSLKDLQNLLPCHSAGMAVVYKVFRIYAGLDADIFNGVTAGPSLQFANVSAETVGDGIDICLIQKQLNFLQSRAIRFRTDLKAGGDNPSGTFCIVILDLLDVIGNTGGDLLTHILRGDGFKDTGAEGHQLIVRETSDAVFKDEAALGQAAEHVGNILRRKAGFF